MSLTSRRPGRSRPRAGFTMIEMMVSMVLVLSVLAMSARLFRNQSTTLTAQSGRVEAQQSALFSLSTLDRDLRMAGVGVVDAQPLVVQADPLAITFNADLISRLTGDPGAVYIDVDADSSSVLVWRKSDQAMLPRSTKYYPDTTYTKSAGVPSGAETISFWFSKDSSVTAANEYVFWRRVNSDPSRVVAKGIRINAADTVFQYFKKDSLGALTAIPPAKLPLFHTAPIHGAPLDSANSALTDSIRTVRVRFSAVYRDPKGVENVRRIDMWIHLMNAGLNRRTTCGDPPIGVTPSAAYSTDPVTGTPRVTIQWTSALDETTGEKDVERYAIYRRLSANADFNEPIASVPAGSSTYTFVDNDVKVGESWVYGVASNDCTPKSSPISATSTIIIP
jgi:prepilin-type N-terminal cleavage/methylation domain-containing protein